MIALFFKQFTEPSFLEGLSERGRRRVFKVAMIQAMKYWHKNILPRHFQQGNVSRYPGYFKEKKNGGIPLVDTGEFRDRILSDPDILGTFKGARIKYVFGRPKIKNGNLSEFYSEMNKPIRSMDLKSKKIIFHSMKGRSVTFEKARKELITKKFQSTTYSSKLRVRMAQGISVFNQADRDEIRAFVQQFVNDNYQSLGRANYRKLQGAEF